MANPFVHVELQRQDPDQAKAFYRGLFDWKLEELPMGGNVYTMIRAGEGTGGGIMKSPVPGAPSAWLAYVLVDDVAATTKRARSLGATIVTDVTEIPNYGWFSVIADPTGAALGFWQRKMTLRQFLDALDVQRREIFAYLETLSDAELQQRKARIPLFKQLTGTDEVPIAVYVRALFDLHWNDHAGQLVKIRKAVGLPDVQ